VSGTTAGALKRTGRRVTFSRPKGKNPAAMLLRLDEDRHTRLLVLASEAGCGPIEYLRRVIDREWKTK
jgi:hypothetical protein